LGHTFAPSGGLVLDEDKTDLAAHSTWRRYGQSKLANILFTHELARRYPEITSVAIHPGAVQTNLANGILQNSSLLVVPHWIVMKLFANTVQQGALNQLWAATAEGVESGAYYVPVGKKNPGSVYAQDEKLSNKLWEWTENEFSKKGI
jgi:retinol dehydrogenase-12